MNPLNPTLPPLAQGDIASFFALIALVTDPKACAERLTEIAQKESTAAETIKQSEVVKAEIAADRAALAAERKKQATQLAADRQAFQAQCDQREQQINERVKATEKLNAEAQATRAEAMKIKADLQARLDRVKSAAA